MFVDGHLDLAGSKEGEGSALDPPRGSRPLDPRTEIGHPGVLDETDGS